MTTEAAFLLRLHGAIACAFLDRTLGLLTWLGDIKVVESLFLIQAAFFWLRRERRQAAAAAGLGVAVLAVGDAVKRAVMRPRPTLWQSAAAMHGASFPSGHAVCSAAFYAFLAWELSRAFPRLRAAFWSTAFFLILLIGFSRLYLGAHWPTDVLGGWLIGGALGGAAILAARRVPAQPHVPGLDPPRS